MKTLLGIIFFVALIFCIGTADAWGTGQITAGRAFVQWFISLAIMWGILKGAKEI